MTSNFTSGYMPKKMGEIFTQKLINVCLGHTVTSSQTVKTTQDSMDG